MRTRTRHFRISLLLMLCIARIAAADEVVLTPYMDAAVAEANPASNYAIDNLAIGKTAGLAWESFLQFDVGSLPANVILTAAELRLVSPVGFGAGGTLEMSAPTAGWAESTVTWSTRPEVTVLGNSTLTVDGATAAHLLLPAPVLAHLQEIVRSASVNRGLKLSFPAATADQLLTLRSRENTSRPQLVITYDLGPELPDFLAAQPKDDGRLRSAIFKAPAGAPSPLELLWNTTPGVRYSVWESPDLGSWSRVSGYPAVADALMGLHEIQTTPPKRFFKVQVHDEQPPTIVSRFPDDGGFGIKRYYPSEEIGIRLTDVTGINPASISLTLGGVGTFTTASPQMTYNDGLLTLDLGGDTAMGAYGALINASLTVADTLGNAGTYNWSFELEREIVLVDGLFTFGSPAAQRAGQRVPPIPTRILADRAGGGGPIRMNDAEWTLESVNADSLVIAYTGTSAPVFTIDQYLNNMTPATLDEIFYRKIASIQDDTVAKKLTLGTVDVPAYEIVTEASVSLSEDDVAFEVDADGRIIRAYQMKSLSGDKKFSLNPLQIDWSDKEIMGLYKNANGSTRAVFGLPIDNRPPQYDSEWDCKLKLKQATLRLRPSFYISAETSYLSLKKLYSECTVEVDAVLEPEFQFIVPSIDYDFDLDNEVNKEPLFKLPNFTILIGTGLWVTVSPRLRAEASITAGLTGTVSIGASGGYSKTIVFDYDKDRDPRLNIQAKDGDAYFDLIEPQVALGGTAGVEFKLKPEIDVKLNSLAGFYLNVDPALGADVNATLNSGNLASADLGVTFNGHINVGMSVLGVSNSLLPSFAPWDLWDKEWRCYFPESLVGVPLQILMQPAASQTIPPGGTLELSVQANYESGVTYEWRHNGRRLFVDSPTLKFYGVTSAAAGNYQCILHYGADKVESAVASVTVQAMTPETLDSDNDGIPNIHETNTGTWVSATNRGTNPNKWDTDGDGLSDGVETNARIYVSRSNTGTNPHSQDTDGDGVNDKREIDLGTDPNAPPLSPANFVTNGDFENYALTGTPPGWNTTYGAGGTGQFAPGGGPQAPLSGSVAYMGIDTQMFQTFLGVKLQPNTTYTITFDAQISVGNPHYPPAWLFTDVSYGLGRARTSDFGGYYIDLADLRSGSTSNFAPLSASPQTFTYTFTTKSIAQGFEGSTSDIAIYIQPSIGFHVEEVTQCYIDNVSVAATPDL